MDSPTPSFWKVLAAPWVGILRPSYAAKTVTSANRFFFLASFTLGVIAAVIVIFSIAFWASMPWTFAPLASSFEQWREMVGEIWQDWHRRGSFAAEAGLVAIIIGIPVLTAVGAWLFWSNVRGRDIAQPSFAPAYRAVAAAIGLCVALTALLGALIPIFETLDRVTGINDLDEVAITLLNVLSIIVLNVWLNRATLAIAVPDGPFNLSPMCEGCGYDLTHLADNGRCSECGREIETSLELDRSRPGVEWQQRQSFHTWFQTAWSAAVRGPNFYERIRVRVPSSTARSFGLWNYPLIGIGAALWVWVLSCALKFSDFTFVIIISFFVMPLLGWAIHRFVAAVLTTWHVVRRPTIVFSTVRQIIAYETIFLWFFCAFNGTVITGFILFDRWLGMTLSRAFGSMPLGIPIEPLILMLGNALLFFVWFRRFHIAILRTQWSNF